MQKTRASVVKPVVLVVLVSILVSCAQYMVPHSFSEQELSARLKEIEPWPEASTNYDDLNWQRLESLARVMQTASPKAIVTMLYKYQQAGTDTPEETAADSKLYLLLRVVFDLPERSRASGTRNVFGGWVTMKEQFNEDGSENRAWPVIWNHGRPYLVSGFYGIQGINARYRAVEEYEYFRRHFKLRNLTSFER